MAYDPPNANGQATMANSSPVVIASDQSAIPTVSEGGTGSGTPSKAALMGVTDGTDLRGSLGNQQGQSYVMDAAPNTATGDHPPNELSYTTLGQVTTVTSLVGAPGSGKRLRIFSVTITGSANAGATSAAVVQDITSGILLTPYCYEGQGFTVPYPKTGIPMVANHGLQVNILGSVAAGGYGATVVYTTETV
jgi:hypothetical protein